jgi:hypothetical protein
MKSKIIERGRTHVDLCYEENHFLNAFNFAAVPFYVLLLVVSSISVLIAFLLKVIEENKKMKLFVEGTKVQN